MNLNDVCILRSNEISREIAGCVGIDPCWSLQQIEKLRLDDITDNSAKKYIIAVKAELPALQQATDYDQGTITTHIAAVNGLLSDYSRWIFLPNNLYRTLPELIKELQKLAIARDAIEGLQDWIQSCEDYVNG